MEKRLWGWVRFAGVIFRLMIIVGLLLLVLSIVLLAVTSLFRLWILILPFSLISLGIILARIEYHLHGRLYTLQSREQAQNKGGDENNAL